MYEKNNDTNESKKGRAQAVLWKERFAYDSCSINGRHCSNTVSMRTPSLARRRKFNAVTPRIAHSSTSSISFCNRCSRGGVEGVVPVVSCMIPVLLLLLNGCNAQPLPNGGPSNCDSPARHPLRSLDFSVAGCHDKGPPGLLKDGQGSALGSQSGLLDVSQNVAI